MAGQDELEVITYTPRRLGTVVDADLEDFRVCLDLYINKALDLNRKESNVRIAVDRIIYMIKKKYEHVGMQFMIINDNAAVGKAIFFEESGDKVAIDVLVDRVGKGDTTF
jgi:hypothetical protein